MCARARVCSNLAFDGVVCVDSASFTTGPTFTPSLTLATPNTELYLYDITYLNPNYLHCSTRPPAGNIRLARSHGIPRFHAHGCTCPGRHTQSRPLSQRLFVCACAYVCAREDLVDACARAGAGGTLACGMGLTCAVERQRHVAAVHERPVLASMVYAMEPIIIQSRRSRPAEQQQRWCHGRWSVHLRLALSLLVTWFRSTSQG